MSKDFELILNNVLVPLQLCLGVWQIMKFTPVGALIKGVVRWSLRPFDRQVFEEANYYVLQSEIPIARSGGVELGSEDRREDRLRLNVKYLGWNFILERRESDRNILFMNGKMCYYIIPTVWTELQFLERVTKLNDLTSRAILSSIGEAVGEESDEEGDRFEQFVPVSAFLAVVEHRATREPAHVTAASVNVFYRNSSLDPVVLKGHREFWEGVITGGIMSFDEVLDGLILHNQHLSLPLVENRLLPVNLSVSEEKLLKFLNLLALILQSQKNKVYWLIPTLLSFISALLEFTTPLRVWLYTKINVFFCSIMRSMFDPLPRACRRQVYSLGKWVENLKPTNDIQLKIQKDDIRVIIAGGAKTDRAGASLVPWLDVAEEERGGRVIEKNFRCDSINRKMTCNYFVTENKCQIDAPTVSMFTVGCRSMEEYRGIITLVSCMAKNGCGSLKSCGPDNKVSVRGFRESVLCYVKSGFPPVYELQLNGVVLT